MSRLIIIDSIFKIKIELSSVESYEIAEENYEDPIEVEHQLYNLLSSNDEIVMNVNDDKIVNMFINYINFIDANMKMKHRITDTKENIEVDGDKRDEVLIVERKDDKFRFFYIYTEPYY